MLVSDKPDSSIINKPLPAKRTERMLSLDLQYLLQLHYIEVHFRTNYHAYHLSYCYYLMFIFLVCSFDNSISLCSV